MNKYKITFTDYVEANTKLEAQENFMNYIRDCAKYSDLDAFEFTKNQDSIIDILNEHKYLIIEAFNPICDVFDEMEAQFDLMISEVEKIVNKKTTTKKDNQKQMVVKSSRYNEPLD